MSDDKPPRFRFNIEPLIHGDDTPLPPELQKRITWVENMVNTTALGTFATLEEAMLAAEADDAMHGDA